MDVFEISGFATGIDKSGVNFLNPADAFETINNGFVYRQEIRSRLGFVKFGSRLLDGSRVMGIFENVIPNRSRECLVCSKEFLYRYNESTNAFDQIPFAGAASSFGITSDSAYVSGTTYLTKTGGQRFVFTGFGMSDVYFYDGVNVQSFTQDNPDYQAPAAGALTKATIVIWFGERLNFLNPVIGGVTNNQGVLYSGIRDSSGNGDKFNVAGSGLVEADTYQLMNGAVIFGDIIIMNFKRSTFALEKTRDAFNPYFIREIPSVIGSDAPFSTVVWNYDAKSAGNTGFTTCDGRQTLRFDNKIPTFASDEIEQSSFDLTYGGFDRLNGQFLFSHRSSGSNLEENTQDKVLVHNYEEGSFSVNDQRFSCFGQTDNGQNLAWDDIDETQNPSWGQWDTTEEIWDKLGQGEFTQKTLAGDNKGFVYQINTDFDDYFVEASNITNEPSAVITVSESAFQVGDRVLIENVVGMEDINGTTATILAASLTSITVNVDSSEFGTYTSGGTVSKLIDFNAKMTPFNPYRQNGHKVYLHEIEVLLTSNRGSLTLEIFEDDETSPFKTAILDPTTPTTKSRQWITVAVNQESNFINFKFSRESASTQTVISAIRIHCDRGGLTSG